MFVCACVCVCERPCSDCVASLQQRRPYLNHLGSLESLFLVFFSDVDFLVIVVAQCDQTGNQSRVDSMSNTGSYYIYTYTLGMPQYSQPTVQYQPRHWVTVSVSIRILCVRRKKAV